jgi:hypothetical protein
LAGGASTIAAVAADSTGADEPLPFVATTLTRSVLATAPAGGVKEAPVSPPRSEQLAPAPSHSSH